MAGGPYVTPPTGYYYPPPPPPTGYDDYDAPPPSPSPTTHVHVKVIVIVVPIVGVICLGLLAALLFVLCIRRRRRRRCPDVEEEATVDEVEDVEVKVTEHVRIVEGVVGEAGEVEAYKAGGDAYCGSGGGGGVVEEAGAVAVAVAGGIVVEDDIKVEEHVVRYTEASKRERD